MYLPVPILLFSARLPFIAIILSALSIEREMIKDQMNIAWRFTQVENKRHCYGDCVVQYVYFDYSMALFEGSIFLAVITVSCLPVIYFYR